jgi:hypothetical protein
VQAKLVRQNQDFYFHPDLVEDPDYTRWSLARSIHFFKGASVRLQLQQRAQSMIMIAALGLPCPPSLDSADS